VKERFGNLPSLQKLYLRGSGFDSGTTPFDFCGCHLLCKLELLDPSAPDIYLPPSMQGRDLADVKCVHTAAASDTFPSLGKLRTLGCWSEQTPHWFLVDAAATTKLGVFTVCKSHETRQMSLEVCSFMAQDWCNGIKEIYFGDEGRGGATVHISGFVNEVSVDATLRRATAPKVIDSNNCLAKRTADALMPAMQ
jgi:hypothetical protein